MNSYALHFFYKISINKSYRTHIIIKYAYFHSNFYSFFQNLLDLMPRLCIFYSMILHEDKLLCLCKIFKLGL